MNLEFHRDVSGLRSAVILTTLFEKDRQAGIDPNPVYLRQLVSSGEHGVTISDSEIDAIEFRLFSWEVHHFPPSKLDVNLRQALLMDLSLLIDAISFLHETGGRGAAWETVGVSLKKGRSFFTRNQDQFDYPYFHTVRYFATHKPYSMNGEDN